MILPIFEQVHIIVEYNLLVFEFIGEYGYLFFGYTLGLDVALPIWIVDLRLKIDDW